MLADVNIGNTIHAASIRRILYIYGKHLVFYNITSHLHPIPLRTVQSMSLTLLGHRTKANLGYFPSFECSRMGTHQQQYNLSTLFLWKARKRTFCSLHS
jgi:hypothetical protein